MEMLLLYAVSLIGAVSSQQQCGYIPKSCSQHIMWSAVNGKFHAEYYPNFHGVTNVELVHASALDYITYWVCSHQSPHNQCDGLQLPCRRSCKSTFSVVSNRRSGFPDGKFFNFEMLDVDALLGRSDWDWEVFTIRNSRLDKNMQVQLYKRYSAGGTKMDAHGRLAGREEDAASVWQTGDVLSFVDPAPTSAIYNHAIGEEAFYYAWGSYCGKDQIQQWHHGLGAGPDPTRQFKIYKVINTFGDTLQAYIGYDFARSRVVMSYRGTTNTDNWMDTNFDLRPPTDYPNAPGVSDAKIHPGFYDAWKELEKAGMGDAIKWMASTFPGSDWLSTGHSLGGALSVIAALELKQSPEYSQLQTDQVDVDSVTFGMPRTLSPSLAAHFNKVMRSSWRIVNRYDVVTTIPIKAMGFHHVGTEVWYRWQRWWWNEDPLSFKVCDGSGEDESCFGTTLWPDRIPIIHHHMNYFEADGWAACNTGKYWQKSPYECLNQQPNCYSITDRDTCLSGKDGRNEYYDQPCVWCGGEGCTKENGNKCEPEVWLMERADKVEPGKYEYASASCA